jgi:hypothetical protein
MTQQMKSVYQEAYSLFLEVTPPKRICRPPEQLTDEEYLELQDWCSEAGKRQWMTGIGVIEAVNGLVETSMENGLIDENYNKVFKERAITPIRFFFDYSIYVLIWAVLCILWTFNIVGGSWYIIWFWPLVLFAHHYIEKKIEKA